MSASTVSLSAQTRKVAPLGKLWWVSLLAAFGAAVVNVLVFTVEKALLGIEFIMPCAGPNAPAAPLPLAPVIFASATPALGATVLLGLLE